MPPLSNSCPQYAKVEVYIFDIPQHVKVEVNTLNTPQHAKVKVYILDAPQYAKVVVYMLDALNMAATQQHQLTARQGLVSTLQAQALEVQSNHMMQKCTCNSLTTALDHIILL